MYKLFISSGLILDHLSALYISTIWSYLWGALAVHAGCIGRSCGVQYYGIL